MDTEAILERRRLRRRASFWRVSAFVILAVAILAVVGAATDFESLDPAAVRGHVAEIRVDGFIETRPEAVKLIKRAEESRAVRAILLHIDSPGGAASGGEALYRAVRSASQEKPVVAVIDGLGASAAYLTAIAADHVIARESAITGSIGVIFQFGHFEDLLGKLGVEYGEVKSAPMKGEPSLFKDPDPAALEMIRRLVMDSYDWFVDLVAERRNLSPEEALRLADGSVFTGRQALQLKLIDAVGSDEEARAWLAAEKGVSGDLPVHEMKEDEPFLPLLGTHALAGIVRLLGLEAGAAALLPRRLAVDGLLSVWQGPGRSER
ncbi:MAG: signal peptide peptidase SppA [Rhizobiales bacterium]|nr:signal peptide peptidase SppA [Hyphomicrobiales bacterium]MDQ3560098.1 signal peptide peptidase SppA [Pseudomonadota bacterium]